jgi:hypothetical protein
MVAAPAARHVTPAVAMTAVGKDDRIVRTGNERICRRPRHGRDGLHRHDRECASGGADQQ